MLVILNLDLKQVQLVDLEELQLAQEESRGMSNWVNFNCPSFSVKEELAAVTQE